jgi:hypothetical protein
MTEHTYLAAQECITVLAFDALARCRAAETIPEKLEHYQIYRNLCDGAFRLRIAYQETLQRMQLQYDQYHLEH